MSGLREEVRQKFGHVVLWRTHAQNVTLPSTLAPCEVGRWTQAARNALLLFLGQNICYFTISMSGQSYTRVMDNQIVCQLAKTVLLKAHNTQILTISRSLGTTQWWITLLYMQDSRGCVRDTHFLKNRCGSSQSSRRSH